MTTINVQWRNRMRQLELERIDQTWLQPRIEPQIATTTKQTDFSEALKRLYFNAGRYAAGARDDVAQKAHAKLRKKGEA